MTENSAPDSVSLSFSLSLRIHFFFAHNILPFIIFVILYSFLFINFYAFAFISAGFLYVRARSVHSLSLYLCLCLSLSVRSTSNACCIFLHLFINIVVVFAAACPLFVCICFFSSSFVWLAVFLFSPDSYLFGCTQCNNNCFCIQTFFRALYAFSKLKCAFSHIHSCWLKLSKTCFNRDFR